MASPPAPGASPRGRFASLNLGFTVGDVRERVEENSPPAGQAAGAPLGALHR